MSRNTITSIQQQDISIVKIYRTIWANAFRLGLLYPKQKNSLEKVAGI